MNAKSHATAAAVVLIGATGALAADKSVTIASWGGSYQ